MSGRDWADDTGCVPEIQRRATHLVRAIERSRIGVTKTLVARPEILGCYAVRTLLPAAASFTAPQTLAILTLRSRRGHYDESRLAGLTLQREA